MAVEGRQRIEDRLRTLDDPDRLAAPFQDDALAFGQGTDVGRDRRAGELGPRTGVPRLDERYRHEPGSDRTNHSRGGSQEPAAASVHRIVFRIFDPLVGHPALRKTLENEVSPHRTRHWRRLAAQKDEEV